MRVRYDPQAREELVEAVQWYERERVGLGAMFHERVKATERLLARSPETYAVAE